MAEPDRLVINCWLPDGQTFGQFAVLFLLTGGLLLLAATELWGSHWLLLGLAGGATLLLTYWYCYCRLVVTPQTVEVVASGFWKKKYACPLEQAMLLVAGAGSRWLLGEAATASDCRKAALCFEIEDDWDTGIPYVNIMTYGEQLFTSFPVSQFAEISQALTTMESRRRLPATAETTSTAPHA